MLEINQAGLSWITILKKAENFYKAYQGFNIHKVAKYGEKVVARLLDVGLRPRRPVVIFCVGRSTCAALSSGRCPYVILSGSFHATEGRH